MRWDDVRLAFPDQWLVIEALEAHSADGRRIFDRIAMIAQCADGPAAMNSHRELHALIASANSASCTPRGGNSTSSSVVGSESGHGTSSAASSLV
jgi:hypothetical protein